MVLLNYLKIGENSVINFLFYYLMYNKMSESKQPRLTKKGLPDKRAETSKKNLEKGKNIIKQALKESKVRAPVINESSDEETDDDEEYEFELLPTNPEPTTEAEEEPTKLVSEGEGEPTKLVPKKKPRSKEMIQNLYNEMQTLRQSNEEFKSILSKQNSDNNRRKLNTHIGILNQEMLLKF